MNTIFRKELKDVLRWTPLGMFVIGLLCWRELPVNVYDCGDLVTSMASSVLIGTSLFAVALGLLQTLFDLRTDARAYLLHRPIAARDIFWGKLAAGLVAHTLTWSIPLLLAAVYLESLGPEQLPVAWSDMALPAMCSLVSFLFHPAAIWMACRNARWVGTKCVPLVLPVLTDILAVSAFVSGSPVWALCLAAASIVMVGWTVIAAAGHAWIHQSALPAPDSVESWSWSNAMGLGAASLIAFVTAVGFVIVSLSMNQFQETLKTHRLAATFDGQLWDIEETWKSPRTWQDEPQRRVGRPLTGEDSENPTFRELDDTWQEQPIVALLSMSSRSDTGFWSRFQSFSFSASKDHGGTVILFQRDGRLFIYGQYRGWIGTVTPQGLFKPDETPLGTFDEPIGLEASTGSQLSYVSIGGQLLLADSSGVYQLNVDEWELRKLTDVPTESIAITLPSDQRPTAILWTRDRTSVRRFSIRPESEDQSLLSIDSELIKSTNSYPLTNIDIAPDGQWALDWFDKPDDKLLSVTATANGGVVFITDDMSPVWQYRFMQPDGTVTDTGERPDVETNAVNHTLEPCCLPPVLTVGFTITASIIDPTLDQAADIRQWSWLLVTLHAIVAGVGTLLLSQSRVQSRTARIVWLVMGAAAGIAAWLAIVAIHSRFVCEACSACQRRRRVDNARCEHCGADWEIPASDGIELIGLRDRQATTAHVM